MPNLLIYIFILIPILLVLTILSSLSNKGRLNKNLKAYTYTRKPYIMTKGENEFFQVLTKILQNKHYIFPQIHLTTFLEHKVMGQTWKGAKAHIDRLSVDYVICDKKHLMPLLAIELDDSTHNREERIERDMKVESILKQAGIPLVRVPYIDRFKEEEIKEKLSKYLSPTS